MSHPLRLLLPASGPSSADGHQITSLASQAIIDVPRRVSVAAACHPCRTRRSKCDGQRPRCAACLHRGIDCEYETEPTETRTQALKRKIKELQEELDVYKGLYEILGSRSEEEIAIILQRIRAGTEIRQLQELIRSGDALLQFAHRPENPHAPEASSERPAVGRGRGDTVPSTTAPTAPASNLRASSVGDRVSISSLLLQNQPPPGP